MMAVPLCNVVNVNHESDIGANSCGECGAVLLTGSQFLLWGILLTPPDAVNMVVEYSLPGFSAELE